MSEASAAGGDQFVGAAEIGDHPLAHRRAVALVFDDLHVAALATTGSIRTL
jgi:hypothetical protein